MIPTGRFSNDIVTVHFSQSYNIVKKIYFCQSILDLFHCNFLFFFYDDLYFCYLLPCDVCYLGTLSEFADEISIFFFQKYSILFISNYVNNNLLYVMCIEYKN